ncbi:MAG: radical SAM protein [Desulfobacterota bacterium]|nr:radical SAM protein [Thermodesulfobacteriota bacterium]
MPYEGRFLTLAPHCTLKRLEKPYLFDIENDQLYELGEEAFQFLLKASRGEPLSATEEEEGFLHYCLSEQLVTISERPVPRTFRLDPSPVPSLRYLELLITDRCNLRCRHCYLGEGRGQDLPFVTILKVLEEFESIQGLRLLLSGGEPLLHPDFWAINDVLTNYPFRSVMLSNGTLITENVARRLRLHEVQLSLDGMKKGHEAIRGEGTFEKVLRAIDLLQEAGLRVSIATMIHRKNLEEFEELASLLQSKGIEEWNVDIPCPAGRLEESQDLWVSPEEGGPLLRYGFGGGFHGSEHREICGAHLCAVLPDGTVAKCGLFGDEPLGTIEEGLRVCWERMARIPLDRLKCRCEVIEECRGGCRFRAKRLGDFYGPDLYQCFARGVLPSTSESP